MVREESQAQSEAGIGRHVVRLEGCKPTPLASYLKALGVLRLVANQKDDSARGWWERDAFHLESDLDRDRVEKFFLEEYEPTPILAPWNGGSGFYPKDNRRAIVPIRDGAAQRLSTLRNTIRDLESRVKEKGLEKRPDPGDDKLEFVMELRSTASDQFLVWLDAAIAMSTDDLMYPPLLGTGGNDGRLDFTNNFLSNLVTLMNPETGAAEDESDVLLADALFADPVTGLERSAIGQFAPGSAGGPNAESGFEGGSLMNPWEFVLMLEGAVLLASSTARRLESRGRGVLAYPFTVRPTGVGSGAAAIADEHPARAETWMPLWSGASGIHEVRHVLSEGRIVVGERMPRDGLDVVRAMARLGVDRGIEAFERFAYLQRSGLAYLATPLGRVRVTRNPDVDLIDELELNGWLDRFRRIARDDSAPARLTRLVHELEAALFDLAETAETPIPLQRCLIALGKCQRYLSLSAFAREMCPIAVPVLSDRWSTRADDGSPEYAIATAIAGLHGLRIGHHEGHRTERVLTTAEYMAPVGTGTPARRRPWTTDHSNRVVWGGGSLDRNMGRMMSRRLLDQRELGLDEIPLHGTVSIPAKLIVQWLIRPEWDRRIADLASGLALVGGVRLGVARSAGDSPAIPAAYRLLKPLFVPSSELAKGLPEQTPRSDPIALPPPAEVVRLLRTNQPDRAFRQAHETLRSRGLFAPRTIPSTGAAHGSRMLAALMVPIFRTDLRTIMQSYFDPDQDSARRSSTTSSKDE